MAADVSVCIVTMNSARHLERCLGSLRPPATTLPVEVIVVDNCSGDGSADLARKLWPPAAVLENASPAGYAANQNRALARATGRYALLLNPDAYLRPGCLERLVAFTESSPHAAAVVPRVFVDDVCVRDHVVAFRVFPTPLRLALDNLLAAGGLLRLAGTRWPVRALHMAWGDPACSGEVAHANGACLLVRLAALEEVGLLDEAFFMFREETDWCFRARQGGWRIHYLAEAQAVHRGGGSLPLAHPQRARLWEQSTRLYLRKHGGRAAEWRYLLWHAPLRPLLWAHGWYYRARYGGSE